MESNENNLLENAKIIYAYTRTQAIDDGVLDDVSKLAKEAGFKFPVAVTCGLWAEVIKPDEASKAIGQSETGRLWDILMILRVAIRKSDNTDIILFSPLFVFNGEQPIAKQLKAVCGPGDDFEPVITIMLPNED
ncbi:MAG: hypothetical protein GY839_03060 [candidate division Zixibacteria bacterium]|nr:hypothetical protein [candidate division Zixibacteria bacterium]